MSKVTIANLSKSELTEIDALITRVEDNSRVVDEISNAFVEKYCSDLDIFMKQLKDILNDVTVDISDTELDSIVLRLPTMLYFISEEQEVLGIREDMSKAMYKEAYNKCHAETSGTISDKTAAGELASQKEAVLNAAISRAYKKMKLKLEAAYEMLSSAKKVLSRRITAMELSRIDTSLKMENTENSYDRT